MTYIYLRKQICKVLRLKIFVVLMALKYFHLTCGRLRKLMYINPFEFLQRLNGEKKDFEQNNGQKYKQCIIFLLIDSLLISKVGIFVIKQKNLGKKYPCDLAS